MIAGIETRLFEGEDGKEKMPKYSLNDLDNGLFQCVYVINSILQLHDSASTYNHIVVIV